jgi:hypothetical protein
MGPPGMTISKAFVSSCESLLVVSRHVYVPIQYSNP